MLNKNEKPREGLLKGIFMAYTILLLHLVLIAGLGLVVIFLTGVANYLSWILIGGIGLIALSAYLFFRRLKNEGKTLGETLRAPDFQGRELEVSLLGGLATMRLGKPDPRKELSSGEAGRKLLPETDESARIREIESLAQLLEKELITREEFDHAKKRLLRS